MERAHQDRLRRRRWAIAQVLLAVALVAFAIWCVDLMLGARALRAELEERIGWLREVDAIDLAAREGADAGARARSLAAIIRAADPPPALAEALSALVDATVAGTRDLAHESDALRRQIRGQNAAISAALGGSWSGLNLAAAAALFLAAVALFLVRVAGRRTLEAQALASALARTEERTRAIVELAGDAILTIDESGRIASINRAGREIFRLSDPLASLDRSLATLLPGLAESLGDAPQIRRLRAARGDGDAFPASLSVAPLRDAGGRGHVVVVRDATADERAATAMTAARDAALAAADAKSEFLAGMSHELRTPLSAIVGFTELMREDALDAGDQARVRDHDNILVASRHLLDLIGGILDLAKIEAGKIDLSLAPIEVEPLIREVATTAGPLVSRRRNLLRVDVAADLGVVISDRVRLRQMLLNLLSNAAKFTADGTITLTVARDVRGGAPWLRIAVRDTGLGVSPAALARLFTPFERGDLETRRQTEGTGLGLAITRQVCELMGGTIRAESVVGEGSTFTLTLPASPAAQRMPA